MFNAIRNGLIGFFIGQTAILIMKDKTIKEKIQKSEGIEKVKALYEALVQTNKKLMEEIQSIDYVSGFEDLKKNFNKELVILEKKVSGLLTNKKLDKKSLKKIANTITKELETLQKSAKNQLKEIDDSFEVTKKIESIKKRLNTIK